MKKIFCLLGLLTTLNLFAAPSTNQAPPCKWAGEYVGVANPITWTRGVAPYRSWYRVNVDTNYQASYTEYDYAGNQLSASIGTVTRSGIFRGTNIVSETNATIITFSGHFRPRGALTGSLVTKWVEPIESNGKQSSKAYSVRSTLNAYREAVLP